MKNIINKLIGMDAGTRTRTVTALVTAILDFLSAFHIIHFDDAQIASIHKIALTVLTAVVWAYASHYKNNDYTEEACEGTGLTRLLKAEKQVGVYTEPLNNQEEFEEIEEEGESDGSNNIG